jgi:hypothetical protein
MAGARGARMARPAMFGAAVIGMRGAAGIRAGIFGMPAAFGIFGPGILGTFPLAMLVTPVS